MWEWTLLPCQTVELGEARMVFGCQTVPIGRDKYEIRTVSLFVHMMADAVDTLRAGE